MDGRRWTLDEFLAIPLIVHEPTEPVAECRCNLPYECIGDHTIDRNCDYCGVGIQKYEYRDKFATSSNCSHTLCCNCSNDLGCDFCMDTWNMYRLVCRKTPDKRCAFCHYTKEQIKACQCSHTHSGYPDQ